MLSPSPKKNAIKIIAFFIFDEYKMKMKYVVYSYAKNALTIKLFMIENSEKISKNVIT